MFTRLILDEMQEHVLMGLDGMIDIRTVYASRLGAIVNRLYAAEKQKVFERTSPHEIEVMWQKLRQAAGNVDVVEVTIALWKREQ
jgi:hypothetical protein